MQVSQQPVATKRHNVNGVQHPAVPLVGRAHHWLHGAQRKGGDSEVRPHVNANGDTSRSALTVSTTRESAVSAPSAVALLDAAQSLRTARLMGSRGLIGLVWLYLYPERGIARSIPKLTDRHLARKLNRQYFVFGEVPFDPAAGFKALFDATQVECEKLLNGRAGELRVRRINTRSESHLPPTANVGIRNALAAQGPGRGPGVVVRQAGLAPERDAYEGVVTSARRTTQVRPNGTRYTTFCLTLNDGLRETPFFGTDLERQSEALRLAPGDRVRIAFVGKVLTEVPRKSRPAFRNLFRLERVDGP